jgi:YggT family protein
VIIIYYILTIFQLILLARSLISWFPNIDRSNPIIRLLYDVTEPVLRPVRQFLPQNYGIDFSPLVVFLIITVLLQIIRF